MVQASTRHTPSFAVVRITLGPAEAVCVESGAMMASSYGLAVETSAPWEAERGLVKSLAKAALGGESLPASTFTASDDGGWIDLAPVLPGDVQVTELDGTVGWCVNRASWLGAATTVDLRTQWAGFRESFGGENGFLLHASGTGPLVTSCYGVVDVLTLRQEEFATVDTGHVVAFADTVQSRIRPLSKGTAQSMAHGDGLVFDFAGPGQIYLQTRNPRVFASRLHAGGMTARS